MNRHEFCNKAAMIFHDCSNAIPYLRFEILHFTCHKTQRLHYTGTGNAPIRVSKFRDNNFAHSTTTFHGIDLV